MNELYENELLYGNWRNQARNIQVSKRSADIILNKTGKKVEVKWGMLYYRQKDPYVEMRGADFWGWGFGEHGTQFKKDKFDYCVLICAERDGARPIHIFVFNCEEMKEHMVPRVSGKGGRKKTFYFLQYSDNPKFFDISRDQKYSIEPCELEKRFRTDPLYRERWIKLKEFGEL